MNKREIRKAVLNEREGLSWPDVQGKSQETARQLLHLEEYRKARTILVYLSIKKELQTEAIIKCAWQQNKTVTVPVCQKDRSLLLSRLDSFEQLAPGTMNIPEPKPEYLQPVPAQAIDLVLLPGVAFDLRGNRIGYGGGYYDRFLKTIRPDCTIIALAYELQLVPFIAAEAHDLPAHLIVTEKRVYDLRKTPPAADE